MLPVKGYRPSMLAVRSVEGNVLSTKLFRLNLFWLFTIFGMTLPYRIWFKRHCEFLRVSVVKETSCSLPNASSSVYRRWVPSKATMRPNSSQFRSFMVDQALYNTQTTEAEAEDEEEPKELK